MIYLLKAVLGLLFVSVHNLPGLTFLQRDIRFFFFFYHGTFFSLREMLPSSKKKRDHHTVILSMASLPFDLLPHFLRLSFTSSLESKGKGRLRGENGTSWTQNSLACLCPGIGGREGGQ